MGCSSCKKKVVSVIPNLVEEVLFTEQDYVLSYHELTNMKGVDENQKPFISSVYKHLFKEDFDWNCGSCVSVQVRKFHNYLINDLKIKL